MIVVAARVTDRDAIVVLRCSDGVYTSSDSIRTHTSTCVFEKVPLGHSLCNHSPSFIVCRLLVPRSAAPNMAIPSLHVLHARKRVLDADAATMTRDLKKARAQLRVGTAAARRGLQLEGNVRRVALSIYVLSDAVIEPVLLYLRAVYRQRHWAHLDDAELTRLVVDDYLAADMTELFSLTDAGAPLDPDALAVAMKRLNEWAGVTWAATQNKKGITPSTSALLDALELRRPDFLKHHVSSRPWGNSSSGAARKRASRLRVRLHGRIGSLRVREEIPVETMRAKAFAAWQWLNHLQARVPAGKTLLRVNLDETPICLFQGHGSGNIFLAKSTTTAQNVPRWTRRAYLTHVAFVCDNPEIQFVLPQVIIANERTLPASQLATVRALCAPNVRVLRAKSAWVNEHIIGQLIRWLAAALRPYVPAFQPLLLFDAAPQHLGPAVWRACSAVRIWPILVPAKLTWLLQVLDTHVFAAYKVFLQKAYQETRVCTDNGHVGVAELLASVQAAIKTIIEARHWTGAFDQNGFSAGQASVSNRVLQELNVVAPVHLPSTRPSLGQLRDCFPRHRAIPEASLWRCVDLQVPGVAVAVTGAVGDAPPPLPPPDEPPDLPEPICFRTRSRFYIKAPGI